MRAAWPLLVACVVLAGCGGDPPTATTTTTPAVTTTPSTTTTPVPGDPGTFEGERAFARAKEQVIDPAGGIRYRIPGTPGNAEVAALIAGALRNLSWNVSYHHFNASYRCEDTPMHNVVAERPGTSGRVVLLGAHYDTRPVAESDPDPENRSKPIPGANDGASGVAVLLELARVVGPTNDTLRLLFFDGEDGGNLECDTQWLLGSTAYAENLTPSDVLATKAMVLVDMVGDPDLVLPKEQLSRTGPGGKLQERIYAIGGSLGYAHVFTNDTRHGWAITDDHKPFLDRGVAAIDLIHLTAAPRYFPATHHTQADTLENISAGSLEIVGRTLEAWLEQGAPAQ